ncbi:MAG: hypothetical protein ACOYVD_08230 [Bacillota bacterium]
MRPKRAMVLILVFLLLITGCASNKYNNMDANKTYKEIKKSETSSNEGDKKGLTEDQNETVLNNPENIEIDLQQVKPNEVGQIMVLMYHAIGEPEAEFRRTPENFRNDLQYSMIMDIDQ